MRVTITLRLFWSGRAPRTIEAAPAWRCGNLAQDCTNFFQLTHQHFIIPYPCCICPISIYSIYIYIYLEYQYFLKLTAPLEACRGVDSSWWPLLHWSVISLCQAGHGFHLFAKMSLETNHEEIESTHTHTGTWESSRRHESSTLCFVSANLTHTQGLWNAWHIQLLYLFFGPSMPFPSERPQQKIIAATCSNPKK